jgi:hypothetical protein
LEDSAAIHELGVGVVAAVAQDIARSDLIGALEDIVFRVWIVDLMKFSFDADVIPEIEGGVKTVALEFLRTIVSVRVVKHRTDLQVAGA